MSSEYTPLEHARAAEKIRRDIEVLDENRAAAKVRMCIVCRERPVIGKMPGSWNSQILCAPCKADEDDALQSSLRAQARMFDAVAEHCARRQL